jgi:transcriptional regulator with XRE-family HTH domain
MNRFEQVRKSMGKTQQEVADAAGVTRQAIGGIERGSTPGGEVLVRIARALGTSSAYLLGRTDSPERDDSLPEDWQAVVEEAMAQGISPEQARRAIAGLRLMLGLGDSGKG